MELYQLKTFVAVAEERSLTRAAERVFTSPPAVSAQIKALEDELGVQLFERTPRGMVLTSAGERLLEEAQVTLAAASRIRNTAAQLRGQAQGVVRFGIVAEPLTLRLGHAMALLAARHPRVTLQLHQGLSAQVLHQLRRDELDCACVMSDAEEAEGVELVRLGRVELVVALPMALAERHPDPTLQELVRLPWVGTPTTCVLRRHLDGLFASVGRTYEEAAMASTEGSVRSMIASGIGVGIVRHEEARQAQARGELRIWPGWRSHTWICWATPPRARHSDTITAVRETVEHVWREPEPA
jgi:DNA-binding transcriptional LysR family regulator